MSWEKKKFIDFILLQRGYDLTKEQIVPGIYPVVTSTSIMGYHSTYKAKGPGVVTGRSGTIGEVQYIDNNYWPHNTSLYVKDFKGNNPRFVYYFLKNFGTARAKSGAAVPTLNRNSLSGIEVYIPNLDTQIKVANILTTYDNLIENNQKQIKLLEEAAQRLYKEWFVDFHFPGYEDIEFEDGHPKGWALKALSLVATLKAGGDKPKVFSKEFSDKCSIPVYSNGTENEGLYGYTNEAKITDNSITISARGSVGYTCLRRKPYVPIVRLISVIPTEIDVEYLYMYLKNYKFQSNGAAQQQITVPMIKDKEVLIPSGEVLNAYRQNVLPMFDEIDNLKRKNQILTEVRDRLISKLMTGEIEVKL